jgi:uncharacterized protein YndB with AHSA1/START domain
MTFTHTHSWSLAATPERVFRALTDANELTQWFAEGATVEPRVGGVYRFWGRHTLGTPPQDAARQTVSRYEPPTALGFNWPIDEVDTDVTMSLVADEKGTTLTIAHRVHGDLNVPRQQELIADHWRLAIGNLIAHLAGSSNVVMPDYFDQHPESE